MKPSRNPPLIIALILLLVAVAFLGGTIRLIRSARAAEPALPAAGTGKMVFAAASNVQEPEMTPTPVEGDQAGNKSAAHPPVSADTGGIIALAIVIVVTILLGAAIGLRKESRRKPIPK